MSYLNDLCQFLSHIYGISLSPCHTCISACVTSLMYPRREAETPGLVLYLPFQALQPPKSRRLWMVAWHWERIESKRNLLMDLMVARGWDCDVVLQIPRSCAKILCRSGHGLSCGEMQGTEGSESHRGETFEVRPEERAKSM